MSGSTGALAIELSTAWHLLRIRARVLFTDEVDENGHVQHRILDILTIEEIEELSRSDKEKEVLE